VKVWAPGVERHTRGDIARYHDSRTRRLDGYRVSEQVSLTDLVVGHLQHVGKMRARGPQHRLRLVEIGDGIAIFHCRLLSLPPRGELYLVEAVVSFAIAACVVDQAAGAFCLGERALIGIYCVMQVMGMHTR
jgi:hypothetical protein